MIDLTGKNREWIFKGIGFSLLEELSVGFRSEMPLLNSATMIPTVRRFGIPHPRRYLDL